MDAYRESGPPPVVVMTVGGKVLGVDASSGELRWEHDLEGSSATSLQVTMSRVYVCSLTTLVCLDYPSGAVRWKEKLGGRATLILEGGRLYVATTYGELDCYSLDGLRLWHNPLKGKGRGSVAVGVPGNVTQADES